jgi:hypothetical protein
VRVYTPPAASGGGSMKYAFILLLVAPVVEVD